MEREAASLMEGGRERSKLVKKAQKGRMSTPGG